MKVFKPTDWVYVVCAACLLLMVACAIYWPRPALEGPLPGRTLHLPWSRG